MKKYKINFGNIFYGEYDGYVNTEEEVNNIKEKIKEFNDKPYKSKKDFNYILSLFCEKQCS